MKITDKTDVLDDLWNILKSKIFEERLKVIAENYPNLKQEQQIRNAVLEIFNTRNAEHNPLKAVAEYRYGNKKVDLCFLDQRNLAEPVQVEFKFQFSKDFRRFEKYKPIIDHDLLTRKSDAFVLVVTHWNQSEKITFDNEWNLTPDLNRYICNRNEEFPQWQLNLEKLLNSYSMCRFPEERISIRIDTPYPMSYYIYLLVKHSGEDEDMVPYEEASHDTGRVNCQVPKTEFQR